MSHHRTVPKALLFVVCTVHTYRQSHFSFPHSQAFSFLDQHFGGLSAQRDPKNGDVWFTLLDGQVFRIQGEQMQYCFGNAGVLVEQSPFMVESIVNTSVTFCWRKGLMGMPTHALNCRGCDCAKIQLDLDPTDDSLHFQFWQSPPVLHADIKFTRSKTFSGLPNMTAITSTMADPYIQCRFVDHYGPNLPGEPDLHPKSRGCAANLLAKAKLTKGFEEILKAQGRPNPGTGVCKQLNGLNFKAQEQNPVALHFDPVPDVRVQFIQPTLPCDPCDVSYSVSSPIAEDEYIGVGFKGESWEVKAYAYLLYIQYICTIPTQSSVTGQIPFPTKRLPPFLLRHVHRRARQLHL